MVRIAIDEMPYEFVFVKINVLIENVNKNSEEAIYACARGFWALDINECRKAQYVIAMEGSVVKGVYCVKTWHYTQDYDKEKVSEIIKERNLNENIDDFYNTVMFVKNDDKKSVPKNLQKLVGNQIWYKEKINKKTIKNIII